MLNTMKKKIVEDIKKSNESGEMNAQEVENIVENAVAKTEQNTKKEAVDIGEIAKEAVSTAIRELKSAESVTKKAYIEAAVQGTVKGISKGSKEIINDIDMEL